MRKLKQSEIDAAPHWAKSYAIHAPSGEPIFYAHLCYGATPMPRKEFDISDCKCLSRFDRLKLEGRLLEVGHNKYESLFFGKDQIIEAAKLLGVTSKDLS